MTNLLWPGDHRAGGHMTDQALLQSMVAVESAWLGALAAAGLAPAECAGADLPNLLGPDDREPLAVGAEDGGNPIVGLVGLLRRRADPAVAPWIHRGLTSQDVLDTSLMLGVRAVVDHLLRVEAAFFSGDAADDDLRVLADEDGHIGKSLPIRAESVVQFGWSHRQTPNPGPFTGVWSGGTEP